jgi:hypothetical protein
MARTPGADPIPSRGADARSDAKLEIAAHAARLIAEEGFDYASAKRKAARALAGDGADARALLPDNSLVESELRRYLATFAADTHPPLLAALRRLALQWMRRLEPFNPHLTGAVLNGTATEHSDIHLQLFTDSAKDVEIHLLNEGIEFDVDAGEDAADGKLESLVLLARAPARGVLPARVGVHLDIYAFDAIRIAARSRSSEPGLHPVEAAGRASIAMVDALLDARLDDKAAGAKAVG